MTGGGDAGTGTPLLEFRGVSKRFGDLVVLDDVSFRVEVGSNVVILGPSGTGKSVLLKLIVGLLSPDDGEIILWGESTDGLDEEAFGKFRRRIGFCFQSGALFDSMTAFDNVAFPLRELSDRGEAEISALVEDMLERVGLPDSGPKFPSELSGGMRKRVALARTLSFRPELVLYDEPTTGLDPLTSQKVAGLIQNLDTQLGSCSITVTHDILCARAVAARWLYLSGGRFLADGTPQELASSPNPELSQFFSGALFHQSTDHRSPRRQLGRSQKP